MSEVCADCTTYRPLPLQLWLKPIEGSLDVIRATVDKPLAELTMPELAAWALVLAYAGLTGYIAGHIVGNIAVTALRGPGRR